MEMFYQAISKTGDGWEDNDLAGLCKVAVKSAVMDLRTDLSREFVGIYLYAVDNAVDLVDENTGNEWTYYINKRQIGYINVSRKGVLMYLDGLCSLKIDMEVE